MAKVSNKVAAVVVTYNRKELLKECINALLNQDYDNCDVLIVDNGSTDGTKEYIKQELKNKKILYYNTGENLGGAGGFNYGIRKAVESGYDYMWIMDEDCIVKNDSLTELIKADKEKKGKYGFLASKVLWKDNSICKMNIQKNSLFKKNSNWESDFVKIIMSTFVSFFIKRETVIEFGLPIKDFFIWSDDLEYSRRISLKLPCYLVNKSIVTHKSKTNIGSNIVVDDKSKLNRYRCAYRNEYYLFRREGIIGKIYYFFKIQLHKHRIKKSDNSNDDKKTKLKLIKDSVREGKKFYPKTEYVYDKPIRVLQLFGEPLSNGGQESSIMNLYRNIDRTKIQFDFFTPFYIDNEKLKKEIESLGGKIYASNGKFNSHFRKIYFSRYTKKFLKNNKYSFIHINSGSLFQLAKGSRIAYKAGIRNIICHSHATGINNLKYRITKILYSRYFKKYPTNLLACSNIAATWKYPKSETYSVIKNGIDLNRFKYDRNSRVKYRNDLKISNKKVLINVGRLSEEKNHLFLLDILNNLVKKDNTYTLLIVGAGELNNKISRRVRELELENNVKLLGARSDIPELLSASDIFIFPSLWEGLGIAAIEAQASGLPVLCSDTVAKEAQVLKSFKWLSLKENASLWANEIIKTYNSISKETFKRESSVSILEQYGFDAKDSAQELEKIYLNK